MWINFARTKRLTLDRSKIELSISIKQVHKRFIFLRLKHDEFPSLHISFWPSNPLLECNAIPTPFLNLYLKFRECVCPVSTPPLISFFLPSCAFDFPNLNRRRAYVVQLSKFLFVVLLVVQTYWIMILTWWQEPVYI